MSNASNHDIPSNVRAEIENRLTAIEKQENVQILMAIESGSRAWGFPSPDSDYDVRFIYIQKRDWYLSLKNGRDVIEQPILDEIDLNGWDIRKALGLLLKSNAVVNEWMESPIRYCADHSVILKLKNLADDVLNGRALANHYANLGKNNMKRWLEHDGDVPVKRYFYSLRPALAIRYLRYNQGKRPPMNLQDVVKSSALSDEIIADIDELIELKKVTNEKSNGIRKNAIDNLIRDELGRAQEVAQILVKEGSFLTRADKIFLELVNYD